MFRNSSAITPEEVTAAYRAVFSPSDKNAQIVVADLAERCGVFGNNFTTDAMAMAFQEGKRQFWNMIAEAAGMDDDYYMAVRRFVRENNLSRIQGDASTAHSSFDPSSEQAPPSGGRQQPHAMPDVFEE